MQRGFAETANWKTYTNKKYAFQIRYPSDETITEQMGFRAIPNTIDTNLVSAELLQIFINGQRGEGGIFVQIFSNPNKQDITNWVKDFATGSPQSTISVIKKLN